MVKSNRKKSKVPESEEEVDSGLVNEELVLSFRKMKDIQEELNQINKEADNEVSEVVQKYTEMRMEIYTRRNDVLITIPDFWLTAFQSHPALGEILNEKDIEILRYLVSLDLVDFNVPNSGYSITFNFSPNPYFENEKLTKTYSFSDEATVGVTGTEIKWKEELHTANKSAQEAKGKGLEDISFFLWFSKTEPFVGGALDEVAYIIKEDIWPNPLKIITAEANVEIDRKNGDDEDKGMDGEGVVQDFDEGWGEIDVEEGIHDDGEGVQGDDEGDGQEDDDEGDGQEDDDD